MKDDTTATLRIVESQIRPEATRSHEVETSRQTAGRIESVVIVGLGYVGLPTALSLFAAGKAVTGVDLNETRLDNIRHKSVDLVEADMRQLDAALGHVDFTVTSDTDKLSNADAILICVPTPVDSHLVPDLTILHNACETVVKAARPGQLIVLTSTSYVGTTRNELIAPLARRGLVAGRDINVAFSPERIDPANPISHTEVPRIVGGETPACAERTAQLFGSIQSIVHRVSNPKTAELTKLYENTFRAVNVALVNEMADISQALGVDVTEAIDAASTKPYGFMPFRPGPGVGGHCIPCDPHYLTWQLKQQRVSAPIVEQAMDAIASRPAKIVSRIIETLAHRGKSVANATILVYGVAYKAGVEDTRESPAIEIIERLQGKGAYVTFYDERVSQLRLDNGVTMRSLNEPAGEWDIILVHTMHDRVAALPWLSKQPLILDATYTLERGPHCHTP